MITIIYGNPGAGKSSFNAYLLKEEYRREGLSLYDRCCNSINELNESRERKLRLPHRVPIFSDFKVSFLIGYEEYYEPYYINGYYFGLDNEQLKPMFLPPFSKIHLGEAQRYFDSRKSKTFPGFVSRAFEMHRHFGLDIIMDVQRVNLIDLNIRQIAGRFIEVLRVENETMYNGVVNASTWYCREFDSFQDVNDFNEFGKNTYRETKYYHEGNIFDCYDSFSCFSEFLPPAKEDFTFLRHLHGEKIKDLPEQYRKYYEFNEPTEYRTERRREDKK